MACTNMNTQMGTKWFTFYTKVRPWLSCVFSLPFVTDFIQYTDVYLEHWWLVVYAVFSFAAPVLSVMVFVKSRDDYEKFVGFVTGVLFFESVCFPYQFCVQQYVANSMDGFSVLVIFAVALVLYYFLWFRLNVKYFTKRIITKESMPLTRNLVLLGIIIAPIVAARFPIM